MAQRELCMACRRPIAAWPTDYEGLELCACLPNWGYETEYVAWPVTPAPKQPSKAH